MRPAIRHLAPGAIAIFLAACEGGPPGPEQTATRFFEDARRGRADRVWAQLSEQSREALLERHAALRAPGATPSEPEPAEVLDALGLTVLGPADNAVVVSPLGDRITVRVSNARGSTDLALVRRGGGWRVDLWGSLARTATAAEPVTPRSAPRD